MDPKIDFKLLLTQARPPRYATFIHQNDPYWKHSILRIIEKYSNYWGGANNIIIPTDGKEIKKEFWKILEYFSPDYLCAYNQTYSDFLKADPKGFNQLVEDSVNDQKNKYVDYSNEQLNEIFLETYLKSPYFRLQFDIDDSLKSQLIKRLNPFYYNLQNTIQSIRNNNNIEIKSILKNCSKGKLILEDYNLSFSNQNIELLFRSYLGSTAFTQENKNDFSTREIISGENKEDIQFDIKQIGSANFQELLNFEKDINSLTPFNIVSMGLLRYYKNRHENHFDRKIYVIVGDSLEDYCLYYSLKGLLNTVIWIPSDVLTNKKENGNYDLNNKIFYWILQKILDFQADWTISKEIGIISFSLDDSVLKSIEELFSARSHLVVKGITFSFINPSEISNILKDSIFLGETVERKNRLVEQFIDNTSVNFINTPVPRTFSLINAYDYHWITDISILSTSYVDNAKDGYILPPLSLFSEDVFPEDALYNNSLNVRHTGNCFSFICPNMGLISSPNIETQTITPRIKLLEPYQVFLKAFHSVGYFARFSDKGNYTRESIKVFGTLENLCSVLTNDKKSKLLEAFGSTVDNVERAKKGIEGIFIRGRSYLNYADIVKIMGGEISACDVIDDFVFKGIFSRGFALWCQKCSNLDWYSFSSIDENFVCSRCNAKQIITAHNWKRSNEPNIFYKLNEVFYQGFINNMKYPLLTLNYLKRKTFDSFIYMPELVLENYNDSKEKIEIDVVCVSDGELIIGEVKKNDETPTKLELYCKIANELNAQFLLSTFADNWSKSSQSKINKHIWDKPPKYIVKNDLIEFNK